MIAWCISGFFLNLLATFILARHNMDYGQVFCCLILCWMGPIMFGLFLIFFLGMRLGDIRVFKEKK